MCEPTIMALTTFALSAASAGAGFMAQQEAADEQNRVYAQNRTNALQAFADRQTATNQRIAQEQDAAAADKFDSSLKARQARATTVVAAGEAGVSGLSIEGLIDDISRSHSRYSDRVDQSRDWTIDQLQAEKRGQGFQAVDRINSVRRATRPNPINLGLQIAGAGLDAAGSYRTWSRGGTVSTRRS